MLQIVCMIVYDTCVILKGPPRKNNTSHQGQQWQWRAHCPQQQWQVPCWQRQQQVHQGQWLRQVCQGQRRWQVCTRGNNNDENAEGNNNDEYTKDKHDNKPLDNDKNTATRMPRRATLPRVMAMMSPLLRAKMVMSAPRATPMLNSNKQQPTKNRGRDGGGKG